MDLPHPLAFLSPPLCLSRCLNDSCVPHSDHSRLFSDRKELRRLPRSLDTYRRARARHLFQSLQAAMTSYDINIRKCASCSTREIRWYAKDNTGSADYTCTRCLDLLRINKHRTAFLTLHRQIHKVLPQVCTYNIYDFIHPVNYSQWREFNRHNYSQRSSTIRLFLAGAPWTNNWIHDLHRKLQRQSRRDLLWRGKVYRTSSWDSHTDVYVVLCGYLI